MEGRRRIQPVNRSSLVARDESVGCWMWRWVVERGEWARVWCIGGLKGERGEEGEREGREWDDVELDASFLSSSCSSFRSSFRTAYLSVAKSTYIHPANLSLFLLPVPRPPRSLHPRNRRNPFQHPSRSIPRSPRHVLRFSPCPHPYNHNHTHNLVNPFSFTLTASPPRIPPSNSGGSPRHGRPGTV